MVLLSSDEVTRRPLVVASRLLAIASVLLYFGLGVLFLVPGYRGEPYWARARIVYGVFLSSQVY
jgi:hypothetical protein